MTVDQAHATLQLLDEIERAIWLTHEAGLVEIAMRDAST